MIPWVFTAFNAIEEEPAPCLPCDRFNLSYCSEWNHLKMGYVGRHIHNEIRMKERYLLTSGMIIHL